MAKDLEDPQVVSAIIGGIFLLASTTLAVFKGGDILRVLQQRKMYRLRAKLQRTCPHVEFSKLGTNEGELPQVCLLFVSPVGTINYYCQLCNSMAREFDVGKLRAYWKSIEFEDIKREIENYGKARKLRNKLDSLGNWASE